MQDTFKTCMDMALWKCHHFLSQATVAPNHGCFSINYIFFLATLDDITFTDKIEQEWFRIIQKKLVFLHQQATLGDDSLAKEVYTSQKNLALPGLVQECEQVLVNLGVIKVEEQVGAELCQAQ